MRLTIPLPYGQLTLSVNRTRQGRPLFWCTLLSAALHVSALSVFVAYLLPRVLPQVQRQPITVSISSALRIERMARPRAARNPSEQPAQRFERREPDRRNAALGPQRSAEELHVNRPSSPERAPSPSPVQHSSPLLAQLQHDTREFAKTAARLTAQDSPAAGLATPSAEAAASKRYTIDIAGYSGKPQPEGILYPFKRWIEGAYVYYYVRYLVSYEDGTTETGSVPWPIHFLLATDPFARDIHRMPLPGPPPNYVLSADLTVTPLVKYCYEHRYQYCPIEREQSR